MDQLVPPPPSATDQDDLPPLTSSMKETISKSSESTKISTDHLICKTPQESPSGSVVSVKGTRVVLTPNRILICLGTLQFLLGFMMVLFGIYAIAYKASLSHLGGGIWGGLLTMVTGIAGNLAGAEHFCPLKKTAQKVAHTTFLALSLISIAVSQLIVVIASTGLARDVNSVEFRETMEKSENITTFHIITEELTQNYKGLLYNAALIAVSALECITAAVASYRSSRELCSCFRRNEDYYQDNLNIHRSHALVSSWLMEKHGIATATPQIYVVTGTPSSLERTSKISNLMPMPLYAIPGSLIHQPSVMGYPLIPAPLGPVPSPVIPPPNRKLIKVHKYYKSKSRSREPTPKRSTKSRSKSREPQMTEEEVARTYTGLDRTMAEEFINICEMKNASLCSSSGSSDTSTSGCNDSACRSPCHSNSDANSQDRLVNK